MLLNAPQLRPYYRMLHAGYEVYYKGWYDAATYQHPEGREDNTVDHVLVNNFLKYQIEVLQLSTGDRIPACELFETNAQMYEPYAMVRGRKVPIISPYAYGAVNTRGSFSYGLPSFFVEEGLNMNEITLIRFTDDMVTCQKANRQDTKLRINLMEEEVEGFLEYPSG
ncbi:hypothetical protein N5V81_13180 [Escherichia coli]|nr:hypothetical protein [Escherichia coli]